ncbi:hypothetical protein Q5752_003109 [Cryptotrichosporon argae]
MPIQAGTLRLPIVTDLSRAWCTASWRPLTPLDADDLDVDISDQALLQRLLADAKFGFSADYALEGDVVIVRVYLTPLEEYERTQTTARKEVLRALFVRLDRGWERAEGALLEAEPQDLVGIQDIYKLIESPPDPAFEEADDPGDAEVFERFVDYANPDGVRTLLHRYQIRSVARMLKMESQPGKMVDPHLVPVPEAGTWRTYYLNPTTMDVRLEPPRYALSRGGILCEQMGVGKTLMCLALIVATRHQAVLPAPIELATAAVGATEMAERVSPVVTDYAVRHHPYVSVTDLRARAEILPAETDLHPPAAISLVAICANVLATHAPHARRHPDLPPSLRPLLHRRRMHYVFPPTPRLLRKGKQVKYEPVEKVWLADATLVVVPELLVPQWSAEINEHLDDGAVSVLVVEKKMPLPPVEQLMGYDIIMMSVERFRQEGRQDDDGQYATELRKARWKRIILDEGNIANNMTSDAMRLVDVLSIERRWIVSGTPTTNLKQGNEHLSATSTPGGSALMSRTSSATLASVRRWTQADLGDVARLGNMLKGFLAADVFEAQNFTRLVTKPLRGEPAYGAVARVRSIMSAVMVKHRPGVIEAEVALPPSTLVVRVLSFTPAQRTTYNALTALVASNVYTSAHSDVDYFLHPRNVSAFKQVVANLHLACTWFSARDMGLEAALARTLHVLERVQEDGRAPLTPAQRRGLEEAVEHMRAAVDDPAWVEWMQQSGASMPFAVGDGLPPAVLDAWSDSPAHRPDWVDANSLRLIRELNTPGTERADIVRAGWDDRAHKCEAFAKTLERAEAKWRAEMAGVAAPSEPAVQVDGGDAQAQASPLKAKAAAEKASAPRLLKHKDQDGVAGSPCRPRRAGTALDRNLDAAELNAREAARSTHVLPAGPLPLPATLQTRSESAKINHVVRAVLTADAADKFVVFGTLEEIAHLTEALDLAGVRSSYVGASVSVAARRAALAAFAAPRTRVCMLELKFAARGLTLTRANRMLFLAPVWSADVEAQAVKRIHRIGQTRPTTIDILVTAGTFEEDIAARARGERSDDEEKRYERQLIEVPRFVYDREHGQRQAEDGFTIQLARPTAADADADDLIEIDAGVGSQRADVMDPSSLARLAPPPPIAPSTPALTSPTSTSPADPALRTPSTPDLARTVPAALLHATPTLLPDPRPKKRARFADD